MSVRGLLVSACMLGALAACQTSTPPAPAPLTIREEILLAPGQTAVVHGTDIAVTLHGVVSDERCPSEGECSSNGPVTVALSIQQGEEAPGDFTLQTYTDEMGRSPNVQFEGVTNRAEIDSYVIQIGSVTPYPAEPDGSIDPAGYRVTLLIATR